jgi:hypothetical protein
MAHADRPTPSVAAPSSPSSPRVRALVGLVARVTYPYLLGGGLGYLLLTVLSHDLGLLFAGALLVLYGAALSRAVQRQGPPERGAADGAE